MLFHRVFRSEKMCTMHTVPLCLTLPAINDGGSWFIEGACHMNTATHTVEVPFPQAFTGPKSRLFPSAPRYSSTLPDLPRTLLSSNQTVRCDKCASIQTRRIFTLLARLSCERTISMVNCSTNVQKRQVGISPITPRKVEPFIPPMNQGGFLARWL